jgi:hypothetical protein
MGLFDFWKKPEEKIKASSASPPSSTFGANPGDVPKDDVMKALIPNFLWKPPFGYPLRKDVIKLKNLAKNPYVFSVIRTLKDEASTTDWKIRPKEEFNKPGEDFDQECRKVANWFNNPNGNEESFADILGAWIQDLCEIDAAVGVKVYDRSGRFSQLFARDGASFLKNPDIYGYMGARADYVAPMPSDWNTKKPDETVRQLYTYNYKEQAAYFQYGWTGIGMPIPFGKKEIIYIMMNQRGDSIYGRSPLEILYDLILLNVYGAQYNLDFYLNGNTPDGMVLLEAADETTAKVFQERLQNKMRMTDALDNERRVGHVYPVYTGPKADFIPFNLSAKDMDIIEQQKWFTKLIWAAFGVTPDEMGFTEDSNKAVSQTQQGVHKRKALRPMLKKIQYAINTQLMPELDPSGKLEFVFEDYDLDEDVKKHGLYQLQISMGIKTPEMVAEELGIDVSKLQKSKETETEQRIYEEVSKKEPEIKSYPMNEEDYFNLVTEELIKKL